VIPFGDTCVIIMKWLTLFKRKFEVMARRLGPDEAVMWCVPPLDELRFLRAMFVNHAFAPHAHDYYVIGFIERGVQRSRHGREEFVTLPERLIVINPGEMHTGEAAIPDGFAYRALYPSVELMQGMEVGMGWKSEKLPIFPNVLVHTPQLYRQIQWLHRASEGEQSSMALEEGFINFFTALIQQHGEGQGGIRDYREVRGEIRRVKEYLGGHYGEDVSLEQLGELVQLSPYHLARLFRRQVGMPPHRYLDNIRVKAAQGLLVRGMPIVEVAYATGFSSQSHLTRTFRRFIGITPAKYAQQRKIM
jgi:AraC-like DNA-binding protein